MVDPEILRDIAQFVLVIAVLFFFGSGLFNRLFERFLAAAVAENPPEPTKHKIKKNISKARLEKQKKAFWFFVGFLAVAVLLDVFVFPSRFRLSVEWLTQSAVAAFQFGVLVIFFGPAISWERANWLKPTFWVSVVTTVLILFWINHLLHVDIRRPQGIAGLLFLSFVQFFWLFGFLGRIDRNEAEPLA